MFTPTIHEVKKENGVAYVTIIFTHNTDATLSFTHTFTSRNLDSLKASIKAKMDDVAATYTFADALTPGTIDPTPTAPTQAETDKALFFQKYGKWLQVKRAIDAGVLTGNETAVQNLLTEVKSLFKPAYLADM